VHDFEAGIRASGLFWTIPMPHETMQGRPRIGRARFHSRHLAVPDFHDFLNAVSPNPKSTPGHVSFDVRWRGDPAGRQRIRDKTFGFVGEFVPCRATIEFSVSDDRRDVVYTSVARRQKTVGGGIGHERNGRFFS
jgi:hypothetical protein